MHYIYCDAAPSTTAGGLAAVLEALFDARIEPIAACLISADSSPRLSGSQTIGLGLRSWRGRKFSSVLRFGLFISDVLKICLNRFPAFDETADSYCVWVGNDWTAIVRGWLIAKRMGVLRPSIYIVDDIREVSNGRRGKLRSNLVDFFCRRLLRHFSKRFAITHELAFAFAQHFQGTWSTMPLPYRLDELVAASSKTSKTSPADALREHSTALVFTGAMAPAVTPVLLTVLRCLIAARKSDNPRRYSILGTAYCIFASNAPFDESNKTFRDAVELGVLSYRQNQSTEDLIRSLPKTTIFLVPYSSEPEHAHIVGKSFPSKLLYMVTLKRPILIIAPRESSVVKSHGSWVSWTTDNFSIESLESAIAKAAVSSPWTQPDLLGLHSFAAYEAKLSA